MCLIGLAIEPPGPWLLVIAANRDEFHDRHTAPASYWKASRTSATREASTQRSAGPARAGLFAGRDLQGGGTWLGLRRTAGDASALRIAALTNMRPGLMPAPRGPWAGQPIVPPSRGQLVAGFLSADMQAASFLRDLDPAGSAYAGFNLLALTVARTDTGQGPGAAVTEACYLNNLPGAEPRLLGAGIYVLSNATLDVAWPKTSLLHRALSCVLAEAVRTRPGLNTAPLKGDLDADGLRERVFQALADRTPAAETELPSTGLDPARELLLSAPFIADDHYGTRCSTVIAVSRSGQVFFSERSFGPAGRLLGTVTETFSLAWRPCSGPAVVLQ